ncbi:MAG: phosphate uptake regulator PhoU [Nanoarchaeota archaeon]|nr:phosphate uptake regulator PhoU [Nanoarchaeota archaeon]
MEYRKLIAFGKSSHVISIPKAWMVENNLKKGDAIALTRKNENIILRPKTSQKEAEERENKITINVDGKTNRHITDEIISAYINNFRGITLEGSEIKDKSKEIQSAVHDLIALEVMEQDAEKIVAKDFLNMKDINVKSLIQKMDVIARAMISDAKKQFDEDNCENIRQRDRDINRLFFLACRAIKYGLRNPLTVSQLFNIESDEEILNYRLAATYIEKISDTAKRGARYMNYADFNQKQKKQFIKIFNQIEDQYIKMMDAYYKKDKETAFKLCDNKESIIEQINDFYLKNKNTDWIGYLTTELKHMIIRVYSIGRVIYQ